MMKKTISFFLLIVTLSSFVLVHKYYVGKTLIHYDQQSGMIEITSQIFIDDIELCLSEKHGKRMFLMDERQDEDAEMFLKKYIEENFEMMINGQVKVLNFIGCELENETLFCYLETFQSERINSFEISNKILMETFDSQRNIIDLDFPEWEKRIFLNKDKHREIVQ